MINVLPTARLRNFKVTIPPNISERSTYVPSRLPIVRPDGTCEGSDARLTDIDTYSFWITDPELAEVLDRGALELKLDWEPQESGAGFTSIRATRLFFDHAARVADGALT